jgi:hypothetical protein
VRSTAPAFAPVMASKPTKVRDFFMPNIRERCEFLFRILVANSRAFFLSFLLSRSRTNERNICGARISSEETV